MNIKVCDQCGMPDNKVPVYRYVAQRSAKKQREAETVFSADLCDRCYDSLMVIKETHYLKFKTENENLESNES